MPAPHHSKFFTGRMPFLPPNQQRQSTEGKSSTENVVKDSFLQRHTAANIHLEHKYTETKKHNKTKAKFG